MFLRLITGANNDPSGFHAHWWLSNATNVLAIFGETDDKQVRDFTKIDDQFNFDQDIVSGKIHKPEGFKKLYVETWLIYFRCRAACGKSVVLDLDPTAFPIIEPVTEAFSSNRGIVEMLAFHPLDLTFIPMALVEGVESMAKFFRQAETNPAFEDRHE